jgi:GNAT superfamily N-acetyltransferase
MEANLNDISRIAKLFDDYRIFYKQQSDVTGAKDFLFDRISNNESVIFYAESAGNVIGFVQLYPIFSSVKMRRCWLLNDLFVVKNARRQGVAAALLEKAKAFGQEKNASRLLLQTGSENIEAQSLYEKNNWVKQTDFFYELQII